MITKIEISQSDLDAIVAGHTDSVLKWYGVLSWSVRGYLSMNAPTCVMNSFQDMRNAVVRAVRGGVELYEVPMHPQDYYCRLGDLYDTLQPPDMKEGALKEFELNDWTPEQVQELFAQPALQGVGWFGTVVPGNFGTVAGPTLRGVDRRMLEGYRNRGFGDACFVAANNQADPVASVQFRRDPRGESRFGPMPPAEHLDVFAPRENYLWALEEKAADGDYLSHLAIRALFLGVGRFMSGVGDQDLFYIANTHPVPSLAAHIRVWRHRDSRSYSMSGRPQISASESMFAQEGMLEECLENGRKIARAQGGFTSPRFLIGPPLHLFVGEGGEVDVTMYTSTAMGVASEVVDVIGHEAAQGAMAEAASEMRSYGIEVDLATT